VPTLETADTGPSLAEDYLAQSLANSAQWQTDTDSADAAEALTHIYFTSLPPSDDGDTFSREELDELRPFAIISTVPMRGGYSWRRIGAEAWDDSGQLMLTFEYNVPDSMADDNQAIVRWFENRWGKVLRGSSGASLTELAHQGGYLAINQIDLDLQGRANEKFYETQGDFMLASFTVSWGVSA
jgi:hypothetical protein